MLTIFVLIILMQLQTTFSCSDDYFPKIIGSLDQDTVINQIDYSSASQVLIAVGYTKSTNLQWQVFPSDFVVMTPFLSYYQGANLQLQEVRLVQQQDYQATAVGMTNTANYAAVMMQGSIPQLQSASYLLILRRTPSLELYKSYELVKNRMDYTKGRFIDIRNAEAGPPGFSVFFMSEFQETNSLTYQINYINVDASGALTNQYQCPSTSDGVQKMLGGLLSFDSNDYILVGSIADLRYFKISLIERAYGTEYWSLQWASYDGAIVHDSSNTLSMATIFELGKQTVVIGAIGRSNIIFFGLFQYDVSNLPDLILLINNGYKIDSFSTSINKIQGMYLSTPTKAHALISIYDNGFKPTLFTLRILEARYFYIQVVPRVAQLDLVLVSFDTEARIFFPVSSNEYAINILMTTSPQYFRSFGVILSSNKLETCQILEDTTILELSGVLQSLNNPSDEFIVLDSFQYQFGASQFLTIAESNQINYLFLDTARMLTRKFVCPYDLASFTMQTDSKFIANQFVYAGSQRDLNVTFLTTQEIDPCQQLDDNIVGYEMAIATGIDLHLSMNPIGILTVYNSLPEGNYSVTIQATLLDGQRIQKVVNIYCLSLNPTEPLFLDLFSTRIIPFGATLDILFPEVIDPQNIGPLTIKCCTIQTGAMPSDLATYNALTNTLTVKATNPYYNSKSFIVATFIENGNGIKSQDYTFELYIQGSAPFFNVAQAFTDVIIAHNIKTDISLPSIISSDDSVIVTVRFDGIDSTNPMVRPKWGAYENDIISLKGFLYNCDLVHTVQVTLSDSGGTSDYQFSVTFTNTAPKFSTNPTTTFQSYCEVKTSTGLPSIIDAEGDPVIVTIFPSGGIPNYMYISNDNQYFVIDASSITVPDPNTYTFSLIVRDGYLETRYDYLQAKVSEPVPQFKEDIPQTILVGIQSTKSFIVPEYFSPVPQRGVNLQIFQNSGSISQAFSAPVFYDSAKTTFNFSPLSSDLGTYHTLEFKLVDDIGMTSSYNMKIQIVQPIDPYFDSSKLPLEPVKMMLNENPLIELPTVTDPRGGAITLELVPTISFVTIQNNNPFQILFSPSDFLDVETYNVQLKISTDSGGYTYYPMEITVTNTAPQLMSILTDPIKVSLGKEQIQQLVVSDQEGNLIQVSISLSDDLEKMEVLQEFTIVKQIDGEQQQIIFKPTLVSQKGLYNVIFSLSDGQLSTDDYAFQLLVENTPPYFAAPPKDTLVHYMMHATVTLPEIIDDDSHVVTVSHLNLPNFLTFKAACSCYSVFPNQAEYLTTKDYSIVVFLNDGYEEETFFFKITVQNDPPTWNVNVQNQIVKVGEELSYTLPEVTDFEGMQTNYELLPEETTQYPTFARLFGSAIVIQPTDEKYIGIYKIKVCIYDSEGAYGPSQTLKIIVVSSQSQIAQESPDYSSLLLNSGPPVFNNTITSSFVIVQGISSDLQLPHISDPDNNPYTVSISNGEHLAFTKLVKASNNEYLLVFFPNKENSTPRRTYILGIILEDKPQSVEAKPKKSQYYIQLTVLSQYSQKSQSNESDDNSQIGNTLTKDKEKKQIKASLKIQQVTNDQRIKLKISSPVLREDLIDHIKEDKLKLILILTLPHQQYIKIKIEERDRTNGKLIIKMDLDENLINEQQNSKDEYTIEIRVCEDVTVQSNEFIAIIPKNLCFQQLLPPQLTEYQQNTQIGFTKALQIATGLAITGSIFINFFLSSFLQLLWNLMNDISFLTILSLISQSIPGIAQRIQYTMLSFIYLDIFQTDSWFPAIFFPKEDPDDDEAINFYFQLNGFQSMNLIKNLGSTFIYLLALGFAYLSTFILLALAIKIKALAKPVQRLRNKIFWNPGLRFVLQQYPPLLISSLINLYNLNFIQVGDAFGSFGSCLIILLSVIIQIQSFFSIRNRFQMLNQEFIQKYGTLLEGLKNESTIGPYWNVIVLGRWSLTSIILVILRNHPQFQIGMLLFLSLIVKILFVKGKPFSTISDNYIGFFNEVMVSTYLYIMLILTEFNLLENPNIRNNLGLFLSLTVLLSVLVNFSKFLIQAFNVIKIAVQQRKQRNLKNAQQKIQKQFMPFKANLQNSDLKSTVVDITLQKEQTNVNNRIEKQGRKKIVKRRVKKGIQASNPIENINQLITIKPQEKLNNSSQYLEVNNPTNVDIEAIIPNQSKGNNSIKTNKESIQKLSNQNSVDYLDRPEANFFDYIEYRKKNKECFHIYKEEIERRRKKREEFTFKNFNFDSMSFNDIVKEQ